MELALVVCLVQALLGCVGCWVGTTSIVQCVPRKNTQSGGVVWVVEVAGQGCGSRVMIGFAFARFVLGEDFFTHFGPLFFFFELMLSVHGLER
jgi:hypothetical protein